MMVMCRLGVCALYCELGTAVYRTGSVSHVSLGQGGDMQSARGGLTVLGIGSC